MKATKTFDCVEMKNEIQADLAKEYGGLTEEEIEARRREKLNTSDHPAARLWRRLTGEAAPPNPAL